MTSLLISVTYKLAGMSVITSQFMATV